MKKYKEEWLYAIDPGVQGCGMALFVDGELVQAGYGQAPFALLDDIPKGCSLQVILEKPQVYRALKGDPNDLIDVAVAGGEMLGRVLQTTKAETTTVEKVLPAAWKRQLPKDVMKARTLALLTNEENASFIRHKTLLPLPSLMHNVWDAVALGLWGLRRFKP